MKQTNLGDPSDSDSDNDEDVDGVPLDGPDPSSTPGGPKHNGNASSLSAPSPSNASRGGGSSGLRKPTAFPRPVPLEIASKAAADVSDMFSGGPPVDKRNGQKDDGLRIAGPMSPPPPPTALPSSPRGRAPISASVTAGTFLLSLFKGGCTILSLTFLYHFTKAESRHVVLMVKGVVSVLMPTSLKICKRPLWIVWSLH